MTFLMRSMRQIIIAHAQSSIRQCPREMGAYQLHKPPWWKVFSPAASTSGKRKDPEDEVGGNLVGANNPEHATPTLSPHLAYATAFSQVKLFLTSFWSTFSAKIEVPFSIRIR